MQTASPFSLCEQLSQLPRSAVYSIKIVHLRGLPWSFVPHWQACSLPYLLYPDLPKPALKVTCAATCAAMEAGSVISIMQKAASGSSRWGHQSKSRDMAVIGST